VVVQSLLQPERLDALGGIPTPGSRLDTAIARLVLDGESIIDWPDMYHISRAETTRLLLLHELDVDDPVDRDYIADVIREAVLYLTEVHGYQLPAQVEQGEDLLAMFEWASGNGDRLPLVQAFAGMVLKVVHILNFLSARELSFRTPISEEELTARLSVKVLGAMERLRKSPINVVEFTTGQKSRTSMLTKLLIRKETQAYHIFDKMRCRIVVASKEDLLPAIRFLMYHLCPFNYVVPCESINGLVPIETLPLVGDHRPWRGMVRSADTAAASSASLHQMLLPNEFSGPTYRSINSIAAIPLRVDDVLDRMEHEPDFQLGRVVFAQTEFQLLDRQTADENERGENSHDAYKERQLRRVRERIEISHRPSDPPLERDIRES
jgi:uncharacterized protein (TIGR04552 family)